MATTLSSLLSIAVRFTPGGTDDQGDFDPEWALVDVASEMPKGECGACGTQEEAAPPEPSALVLDFQPVSRGPRMCECCVAQEEIAQTGIHDLLIPTGFQAPEAPAVVTFTGRLRWDCFQDYWSGHDECDVEFEPEGEPVVVLTPGSGVVPEG